MLRRAETALRDFVLPPWAIAGLTHLVSVMVWCMAAASSPEILKIGAWPWLEGATAAAFGTIAGLPLWWLPINLLFMPAVQGLQGAQIPAPAYLAAFCMLLLLNCGAWRQRVPLYLSSTRAAALLLPLLPAHRGFRLLDLGSGTGSLLVQLVNARPDGQYYGVEMAPLPFWISWWRARSHPSITVSWGDFWSADLSRHDVVYAYLSPAPMARLWLKASREMRPGSLFISNGFAVPGVAAMEEIVVGDLVRSTLYVWRM